MDKRRSKKIKPLLRACKNKSVSKSFSRARGGGKKARPSPSESATKFAPGTVKKGNDGKMYKIVVTKNGVQRWQKQKKEAVNRLKEVRIFFISENVNVDSVARKYPCFSSDIVREYASRKGFKAPAVVFILIDQDNEPSSVLYSDLKENATFRNRLDKDQAVFKKVRQHLNKGKHVKDLSKTMLSEIDWIEKFWITYFTSIVLDKTDTYVFQDGTKIKMDDDSKYGCYYTFV